MPKLTEQQLEQMFDEVVDSMYGDNDGMVEIAGYKFAASEVFKTSDLVAYRCELANYADSLTRDGYEIEGY